MLVKVLTNFVILGSFFASRWCPCNFGKKYYKMVGLCMSVILLLSTEATWDTVWWFARLVRLSSNTLLLYVVPCCMYVGPVWKLAFFPLSRQKSLSISGLLHVNFDSLCAQICESSSLSAFCRFTPVSVLGELWFC